jgi:hypothetical protein
MEHKKLTPEEIKILKEMEKEVNSPKEETKELPLVKNSYSKDGKEINQFKINIPKKYADIIKLDKENFKVVSKLDKKNNKLIFEVIRNE